MKKIIRKVKGKKVLSFVLAAIMLATTFNIALPQLKLGAEAADPGYVVNTGGTASSGVTQTRVVGVKDANNPTYQTTYNNLATQFMNGASEATEIVIPGMLAAEDYVVQGLTYYPERDWFLVTAYYNATDDEIKNNQVKSSKVFCLDAKTGEFYAMFDFYDPNTTTLNTDHGGGIAVSENNIYYSAGDQDRLIAYAPLSTIADMQKGEYRTVKLVEELELHELGDSYTAYLCYDEGVLWVGNFYDEGALGGIIAADYNKTVNSSYRSMVYGYKLKGDNSTDEWAYLKGMYKNLISSITTKSVSNYVHTTKVNNVETGTGTVSWNAYKNGEAYEIKGKVTNLTGYLTEYTANFATFDLVEGNEYVIEYISSNNRTDMYMFRQNASGGNGPHSNVMQSSQTTITELEDGRYHYRMKFTAGTAPASADSTWDDNPGYGYTGKYNLRFDQDTITENYEFSITDIRISDAKEGSYSNEIGGSAANPSHALALSNAIKDVQYAVVDNGKLYLSCSYGTGEGLSVSVGGMNPYSSLIVADIDLSAKPDVNNVPMKTSPTTEKNISAYLIDDYTTYDMMPMSEGLCFVGDELFITFEGASNKYMNDAGLLGNCKTPIDVIWKLNPYDLMEIMADEEESSLHYEKVDSVADIEDGEEYLIFYKSSEKDPVTQKNILYALNSDGGLRDFKLSKSTKDASKGYDAMIGHAITDYSMDGDILYLNAPEKDDVVSVRWTLNRYTAGDNNHYYIKNNDKYFADYTDLYFNENKINMIEKDASFLSNIKITHAQDSNNNRHEENGFWLSNNDQFYLWCNDGLSDTYNEKINDYYAKNITATPIFDGAAEKNGTFHCNARNNSAKSTTNVIGASISADNCYEDSVFYIYKRIVEKASSTSETRVYTDVKAELQADGTYTVNLETYATSPFHYKYSSKKPTDYIFVMDTSKSVDDDEDGTGIRTYANGQYLQVGSFCEGNETASSTERVHGYAYAKKQIYYHDGTTYHRLYMAMRTNGTRWNFGMGELANHQSYWVYYVDDRGQYNVLSFSGGVAYTVDKGTFVGYVDNNQNPTREWKAAWDDSLNDDARMGNDVYQNDHYEFFPAGEGKPLATAKKILVDTANKINADANANNLDHRIAFVKYGVTTDYLKKGVGWSNTVPTDGSDIGAFFNAKDTDGSYFEGVISGLKGEQQTDNSGMELKLASDIMQYSDADYTASGNRNLAIIFITDGVPGAYDGGDIGNAANNIIKKAYTMKQNGAFIYTAIVGDIDNATKITYDGKTIPSKTYIEAVSSKYPAAQSLVNLGGQSVDGTQYTFNLAACSIDLYLDFGKFLCEETVTNSAVGISNLDDKSVIRQKLATFFNIPSDTAEKVKAWFVPGEFDKIGRFSFNESAKVDKTSAIKPSFTTDTIQITGYDYATEYISKGKVGNKLRVVIPGLTLKTGIDIFNENINIKEKTALYNNQANMTASDAGTAEPFKYLPTQYINVPEYTYVLDYGLDMLDKNVNGTLKSVSVDLSAQRDENGNLKYKSESENGLVKIINQSQDLLYHTTPTNMNDSGYVLIQRPTEEGEKAKYDWFEIKVVPASNVYFEEDDMNVKKADEGTTKAAWTTAGTKIKDYRNLTEEGDVVGFENAYDVAYDSSKESTAYSNGTAKKVTVTQSNRNSKTQTFDFVGTGVDIVSRCGSDTGILLVNIKNSAGKSIAASIVDTYCEAGTFNQTPVFSWSIDNAKGETYGTYTVEVSALYLSNAGALNPKSINKSNLIDTGLKMNTSASFDEDVLQAMLDEAGVEDVSAKDVDLVWFDDNSIFNGGTGVAPTKKGTRNTTTVTELVNYIDGFRVYNPLGTDPSVYTEKNVSYANVIDNLAPIDKETGNVINDLNGIAFITGILPDLTDENDAPVLDGTGNPVKEALTFANYESFGPTGELYLKGGKAISFKIDRGTNEKVMLGLRAVNGPVSISVNDAGTGADGDENPPLTPTITSATEMYYDITECIDTEGEVLITITNNDSAKLLAINQIKFSGGTGANGTVITPRSLARSADATEATTNKFLPITQEDLVAIEKSMSGEPIPAIVKNGVVVPIVEEEIPEDNTNTDNDNTNDGTDTEESEDGGFGILSLIKMLIAFIEQILRNALGAGSIA